MALPLPRVVPDVGPGGGLVTAMGGMNKLSNENILRQINDIKRQYAPLTTQAEAASKLAYANLMGPQFLAKLLGNDSAIANMGSDQAKAALQKSLNAGMGGGNANNIFAQMQQQNQGLGGKLGNSLSNYFADKLKGVFGGSGASSQADNVLRGIAHVESEGAKNPYQLIGKDTGKGDHALGKYQVLSSNVPGWTKEALGQSLTPEQFLNSPEAQEKVAEYMVKKHLSQGRSPNDAGSIWFTGKPLNEAGNVRDSYGTTVPDYIRKMNEGMGQDKTYAQNTGEYKGSVKQLEEEGKNRAAARKQIGESQLGLSNSGAVLDRMADIVKNPVFANMRNTIPGFQDKQLDYLKVMGTPEQKELIGDFLSTSESFIASTVQGFSGKPLVREFDLAQRQKITPYDTIDSAVGKLQSATALHDIAEKKNDIVDELLAKGYNEAEAVKMANKMVDVSAIEKATKERLQRKIQVKNNKTGETKMVTLEEARKMGIPNV